MPSPQISAFIVSSPFGTRVCAAASLRRRCACSISYTAADAFVALAVTAPGSASRAECLPEDSEDETAEDDVNEHQDAGVGSDARLDARVEAIQAAEQEPVHGEVDQVERYSGRDGSGHGETPGGDEREAEEAELEKIGKGVDAVGGAADTIHADPEPQGRSR